MHDKSLLAFNASDGSCEDGHCQESLDLESVLPNHSYAKKIRSSYSNTNIQLLVHYTGVPRLFLVKSGKLLSSFDASPGTVPIPGLRAPRGNDSPIPPDALLPEPSTFDKDECKEQVVAPAAEGQMDSNSQVSVTNGHASVQGCVMRDLELNTQHRNEGKAPSSSRSRPGAFPIQGLRASHDRPSPPDVMAPGQGSYGPDERKCREEVVAPAVGAQGNANVGSHGISVVAQTHVPHPRRC